MLAVKDVLICLQIMRSYAVDYGKMESCVMGLLSFLLIYLLFYSYLVDENHPFSIEDYDPVLPDKYRRAYYS